MPLKGRGRKSGYGERIRLKNFVCKLSDCVCRIYAHFFLCWSIYCILKASVQDKKLLLRHAGEIMEKLFTSFHLLRERNVAYKYIAQQRGMLLRR